MKNFLRKILFLFVMGIISQSCVENTCFASKSMKDLNAIENLSKKDIWEIIATIANGKVQPELDYDMQKILEKYNIEAKEVTFAKFVEKLNGDTLFKLVTLKRGTNKDTIPIIFINKDSEGKHIENALNNICQKVSGRLLLIRLLIALKCNFTHLRYYTLYIEQGNSCHVHEHYVPDANVNDGKLHIKYSSRNKNYTIITLSFDILAKLRYTLFSNPDNDAILMTSDLDQELKNVDVALFHEMTHVLHLFQSSGVKQKIDVRGKECEAFSSTHSLYTNGSFYSSNEVVLDITKHPLFKYYYTEVGSIDTGLNASLMPWHIKDSRKDEFYVNFEEMRTIAGLPIETGAYKPEYEGGYKPGDELSEDLYRAEKRLPLRFGHRMFTYYESKKIYEKVKACVEKILSILCGSNYTYKLETHYIPSESYSESVGFTKCSGLNDSHYFTIDPENPTIKSIAFKEPLYYFGTSIYYYLLTEYNEYVIRNFKFN